MDAGPTSGQGRGVESRATEARKCSRRDPAVLEATPRPLQRPAIKSWLTVPGQIPRNRRGARPGETVPANAYRPGHIPGRSLRVRAPGSQSRRPGGRADVGYPLVALATLDVPSYPPDEIPADLAALPAEEPGSKRLRD